MKYILFASEGTIFPIAKKLKDAGADVTVAIADTFDSDIYSGVFNKIKADKVIAAMETIPDKENHFVLFEDCTLYEYAEKALSYGYTNGVFPTKEHHDITYGIEKYQELAMGSFSHLESCVHPDKPEATKDVDVNMVFHNGVPTYSTITLATKFRDAGDKGMYVGVANSLVIKTDLDSKLNKLAFPQAVHELAAKTSGIFIWTTKLAVNTDTANLQLNGVTVNKINYDTVFGELSMASSVEDFFQKLTSGINPLEEKYGATVRIFNDGNDLESGYVLNLSKLPDFWPIAIKQDSDSTVVVDSNKAVGVVSSSDDELLETIDDLYECVEEVGEVFGYRYKGDFLARDYSTSIMSRYDYLREKGILDVDVFDPDKDKFKKELEEKLQEERDKMSKEFAGSMEQMRKKHADELRELLGE